MVCTNCLRPPKNETLCFCVEYRKLNAVTKRDSYQIPRIDEYIDFLGKGAIFSTLDANSACWQLDINKADKNETAFISHQETYRFIQMPFGLLNAPRTFKRTMDVMLVTVWRQSALVYFDDIVIFSKSSQEHIGQVQKIFSLLRQARVTLKLKKYRFLFNKKDYNGHVVRPRSLDIASQTTDVIRGLKTPTNIMDLRSFSGLFNVFRRFVPIFASLAASKNPKLQKDQPKHFGPLDEEKTKSMNSMKSAHASPPVLALLSSTGHMMLNTDACDVQLGCVLLHTLPERTTKPIGYW